MNEKLGKLLREAGKKIGIEVNEEDGNLFIGENNIETPAGTVKNTTLIGKNTVTSKSTGRTGGITGNRMFGKNKIIIK